MSGSTVLFFRCYWNYHKCFYFDHIRKLRRYLLKSVLLHNQIARNCIGKYSYWSLSELSQIQLEMNLAGKWYVNAKISSMKIQNKGVSSNLHVLMQKVKRLHYQKKTATKYSSECPRKMHLRSKIGFNTSKT